MAVSDDDPAVMEIARALAGGGEIIGLTVGDGDKRTAKQWRDSNSDLKGNIRDYANVSQLVCLSNLESLNAVFISEGMPQTERLVKLNRIAINQMKILIEDHRLLALEEKTRPEEK